MGHKGPVLRPRCIRPGRARTQIPFNSMQIAIFKNKAIIKVLRLICQVDYPKGGN
jgi:hypothetical protein